MRLTISSKANQTFIKDMAKKWEMTEKEALNYLITQTRLNGFSTTFHNEDYDASLLPEVQLPQPSYEEVAQEEFIEADPVIERFIALGITEEF